MATNRRAPGQRLIPIPMSEEFVREINAALAPAGYSDRSKFVRDAVYEKLQRLGYRMPREISVAPSQIARRQAQRVNFGPTRSGGKILKDARTPEMPWKRKAKR